MSVTLSRLSGSYSEALDVLPLELNLADNQRVVTFSSTKTVINELDIRETHWTAVIETRND